jgi:hypothetical protein
MISTYFPWCQLQHQTVPQTQWLQMLYITVTTLHNQNQTVYSMKHWRNLFYKSRNLTTTVTYAITFWQFNSHNGCSMSQKCWVRQLLYSGMSGHVPNLCLHVLQTKWILRSQVTEEESERDNMCVCNLKDQALCERGESTTEVFALLTMAYCEHSTQKLDSFRLAPAVQGTVRCARWTKKGAAKNAKTRRVHYEFTAQGLRECDSPDIPSNIMFLQGILGNDFQDCFQQWCRCLTKCLAAQGGYFESKQYWFHTTIPEIKLPQNVQLLKKKEITERPGLGWGACEHAAQACTPNWIMNNT